jgi:hypothetical protein
MACVILVWLGHKCTVDAQSINFEIKLTSWYYVVSTSNPLSYVTIMSAFLGLEPCIFTPCHYFSYMIYIIYCQSPNTRSWSIQLNTIPPSMYWATWLYLEEYVSNVWPSHCVTVIQGKASLGAMACVSRIAYLGLLRLCSLHRNHAVADPGWSYRFWNMYTNHLQEFTP